MPCTRLSSARASDTPALPAPPCAASCAANGRRRAAAAHLLARRSAAKGAAQMRNLRRGGGGGRRRAPLIMGAGVCVRDRRRRHGNGNGEAAGASGELLLYIVAVIISSMLCVASIGHCPSLLTAARKIMITAETNMQGRQRAPDREECKGGAKEECKSGAREECKRGAREQGATAVRSSPSAGARPGRRGWTGSPARACAGRRAAGSRRGRRCAQPARRTVSFWDRGADAEHGEEKMIGSYEKRANDEKELDPTMMSSSSGCIFLKFERSLSATLPYTASSVLAPS